MHTVHVHDDCTVCILYMYMMIVQYAYCTCTWTGATGTATGGSEQKHDMNEMQVVGTTRKSLCTCSLSSTIG